MFKNKLSAILTILVVASSLLVAYTSLEKDILAPVEKPGVSADQAPAVTTNNDSPSILSGQDPNRRWSGEVFLSDNGSPDRLQQARESSKQDAEPACISLNDGNSARRYGGCVE